MTGDTPSLVGGGEKLEADGRSIESSDGFRQGGPAGARSFALAGVLISRTWALRRGVEKSTPFIPRLTLRVGLENRRTERGVPTLPTLPRGVRQRGRKTTTPLCRRARAVGKAKGWNGWTE